MSRTGAQTTLRTAGSDAVVQPRAEAKPIPLTRAVWSAVAIVVLLQGASVAIERTLFPTAVRQLKHKLAELPLSLGRWTGTEVTLDPTTFAAVGAEDQTARLYKNSAGGAASVHLAAFVSQDDWTPHLPEVCYTANGWELLQSRTVALAGSSSARVAIQSYQRPGQRVVVVYWYQMDQGTYADRDGGRALRRNQWGRRERAPLIKTILQTSESDHAEHELLEIAAKIYEFNCGL